MLAKALGAFPQKLCASAHGRRGDIKVQAGVAAVCLLPVQHAGEGRCRLKLTIHQITAADMDDVMIIERASYRLPCRRCNLAKLVDDAQIVCLMAKSGEVTVATIFLETTGLLTSILGLAVLPDCRRQSIGRALLRMIVEHFSGCGVDCYVGAIVPESDSVRL